jgi:MoaA/NifB/PqqE/SkfB family radical SAM enzyme
MARTEQTAVGPARARVGLPILPDGSRERPLLIRLPPAEGGGAGTCNNGCRDCLTLPIEGDAAAWTAEVAGRHVVLRDHEPTLRRDLAARIRELAARRPASIALLTNGRILSYERVSRELARAGVGRFIVKLFGLDAASHDAHTRVPGAFDQALSGIAGARAAGAQVHVTFPLLLDGPGAEKEATTAARAARVALARRLTGGDPVELPEEQVETYGGEYRWDLVELQGRLTHPYWIDSFFPMAHVNTGPTCNLRCTYCNVHGGDDQRLFDRPYVEKMIDDAARRLIALRDGPGVPTMDFIGGEPTLHPELPALIAHARARGFPQVTICTNGVLLLKGGYLDALVAAGLTGVRFSFHDHRAEVANQLADVKGLGDRYLDVARLLLSRSDVRPHIYRIILSSTVDALPDYVRWLADNHRSDRKIELVLGMPSMRGRLFENRHLYPPLDGLREKVSEAVELAESLGIEALLHHAPACLMPAEPERVACMHVSTIQVDALTGDRTVMNFEGDARFGAACEGCSGKTEGCHGVPSAYFDADSEAAEAWLRPIAYRAARAP